MPIRYALCRILTAVGMLTACRGDTAWRHREEIPEPLVGSMVEAPHSYTRISSVHELPDGRVLVLDYLDRSLFALDLVQGTRIPVSRTGQGPGEYESPKVLHPFRGDSIVLIDDARFNGVMVLSPQGRPVGLRRTGHGELNKRFESSRTASDTSGYLYAWVALGDTVDGAFALRLDSADIERIDLQTGHLDTIARLSREQTAPSMTVAARAAPTANEPFRRQNIPFLVADHWTVLPDGTFALVSVSPYRVTFEAPSGERTVGPELPFTPIPVSTRHKEVWRERDMGMKRVLIFTTGTVVAANRQVPLGEPDTWPPYLPPFVDDGVTAAPDGTVWIQRTTEADSAPVVDVIARDGTLKHRLRLPLSTRFITASHRFIYLVRIDADDHEYVQRWPRPTDNERSAR